MREKSISLPSSELSPSVTGLLDTMSLALEAQNSTGWSVVRILFIDVGDIYCFGWGSAGMICHWKFELLQHYHVSKHDLKPIYFRHLSLLSLFRATEHRWSSGDDRAMYYDIWLCIMIGWCALESADLEIEHMDTWYLNLLSGLVSFITSLNPDYQHPRLRSYPLSHPKGILGLM